MLRGNVAENQQLASTLQKQRPEVFCKKSCSQKFHKFHRNLCRGLFFNKVAGGMCFPMNFVKFLRTPFSQNTSWRLLIYFTLRIQVFIICRPTIIKICSMQHFLLSFSHGILIPVPYSSRTPFLIFKMRFTYTIFSLSANVLINYHHQNHIKLFYKTDR